MPARSGSAPARRLRSVLRRAAAAAAAVRHAGRVIGGVYGAYLLPKPLAHKSVDYVFARAHGQRVEFGTLCGHKVEVSPRSFVTHSDGRKEATAMLITAESADWSLTWSHAMRSSAANPGGTGLGLVVYEQLSMHNLTLTQKSTGQTFAEVTAVPGFTEWSDPA